MIYALQIVTLRMHLPDHINFFQPGMPKTYNFFCIGEKHSHYHHSQNDFIFGMLTVFDNIC